jgi:hypothetical protein
MQRFVLKGGQPQKTRCMKRLSVLLLIASAALLSCKKHKTGDDQLLTGTYKGTFQRVGAPFSGVLSEVTVTFNGNRFSGQGALPTYPAICNGSFTQNGTKLTFDNECVWTANFDWTFILDGEYEITFSGNNVEIIRGYDGIVFYQDIYKLVRQ